MVSSTPNRRPRRVASTNVVGRTTCRTGACGLVWGVIMGMVPCDWLFALAATDFVGLLLEIAVERDPAVVLVLVGDGFGVEPIDHGVLEGVGEEVIAGGVVMADEVTLHVLVEGDAEVLVVFHVYEVHIKEAELVFAEEIDDHL